MDSHVIRKSGEDDRRRGGDVRKPGKASSHKMASRRPEWLRHDALLRRAGSRCGCAAQRPEEAFGVFPTGGRRKVLSEPGGRAGPGRARAGPERGPSRQATYMHCTRLLTSSVTWTPGEALFSSTGTIKQRNSLDTSSSCPDARLFWIGKFQVDEYRTGSSIFFKPMHNLKRTHLLFPLINVAIFFFFLSSFL